MEEKIELHFIEVVQWDLDALSTDFARWMTDDNTQPAATSRVGILSSGKCRELLHGYLGDDLSRNFILLVKASSVLYNTKESLHPWLTRKDLESVRALVGTQLLRCLEAALKTTALARASKERLAALFLVLFGAIVSITYTNMTHLGEARYELIRILAHHMILLGERTGLLHGDSTKQGLIESCHNIWNKTGTFEWTYDTPPVCEGTKMRANCVNDHSHPRFPLASNDSTNASVMVISEDQRDEISNIASTDDVLHEFEVGLEARSQSIGSPLLADEIPGSFDGGRKSSPFALGTIRCSLCHGTFPSDEICPTCFGPHPSTMNYRIRTPPGNLDPGPSASNLQPSSPVNTSTTSDAFRFVDDISTSPRVSERLKTEPMLQNTEIGFKTQKFLNEASLQPKRRSRILLNQSMETTEKAGTIDPKLQRREETRPQRWITIKTTKDVLKWPCSYCRSGPHWYIFADPQCVKKCDHFRCSSCQIAYNEPGSQGVQWTCCSCGDGPKSAQPSPGECGKMHYSLFACRSCSLKKIDEPRANLV